MASARRAHVNQWATASKRLQNSDLAVTPRQVQLSELLRCRAGCFDSLLGHQGSWFRTRCGSSLRTRLLRHRSACSRTLVAETLRQVSDVPGQAAADRIGAVARRSCPVCHVRVSLVHPSSPVTFTHHAAGRSVRRAVTVEARAARSAGCL